MSHLVENLLTGQVFRAQEITDLDNAVRLQAKVGDAVLYTEGDPDSWHLVPEHVFAEAYVPVPTEETPVPEPQPQETPVVKPKKRSRPKAVGSDSKSL